jgi:transmembrane sensor
MSQRLEEALQRSRASIDPRWDEPEVEHALMGMHRAVRKRQRVKRGLAVGLALLIATASYLWRATPPPETVAGLAAPLPAPLLPQARGVLRFADGSTAEELDLDSELQIETATSEQVTVRLNRGRGRFTVAHTPERVFRVEVDGLAIEVLGTRFTVSRSASGVKVDVHEGRVLVRWGSEARVLDAREQQSFPLPPSGSPAPSVGAPEDLPEAPSRVVNPRKKEPAWLRDARQGQFEKAFKVLGRGSPEDRPQNLDQLLLASDSARLSGHPAEAVPYLREVMMQHPKDPRAALAAFSLGKVYLNELHQPEDAALAFAQARKLGPQDALAEDALAREVESWNRARLSHRAKATAETYLRLYPHSPRAAEVRAFGGLE